MIAICLPSRGLVFSETVDEVLREATRLGHPWTIHWSHRRPIPECFNRVTEDALANPAVTHLWFVEEDMGLPEGILERMLARHTPAIAADYPVTTQPSGTILRDPHGRAYFTGTGCLLVERGVLAGRARPLWRSDVGWGFTWDGRRQVLRAHPWRRTEEEMRQVYGFQDVHFGLQRYLEGRPVEIYDDQACWQRKLRRLGQVANNLHGCHEIVEARALLRSGPQAFAPPAAGWGPDPHEDPPPPPGPGEEPPHGPGDEAPPAGPGPGPGDAAGSGPDVYPYPPRRWLPPYGPYGPTPPPYRNVRYPYGASYPAGELPEPTGPTWQVGDLLVVGEIPPSTDG